MLFSLFKKNMFLLKNFFIFFCVFVVIFEDYAESSCLYKYLLDSPCLYEPSSELIGHRRLMARDAVDFFIDHSFDKSKVCFRKMDPIQNVDICKMQFLLYSVEFDISKKFESSFFLKESQSVYFLVLYHFCPSGGIIRYRNGEFTNEWIKQKLSSFSLSSESMYLILFESNLYEKIVTLSVVNWDTVCIIYFFNDRDYIK
ncbi:MAG: hypothetical protein CNLJKLNK_00486 [Holosporales bacterium]